MCHESMQTHFVLLFEGNDIYVAGNIICLEISDFLTNNQISNQNDWKERDYKSDHATVNW